MKNFNLISLPAFLRPIGVGLSLVLMASANLHAAETGRTFATPEAAVAALLDAVRTTNTTMIRDIFGPAAEDLVNPDPVQAANEFTQFMDRLSLTNRIAYESATRRVLEIGPGAWPFPVPIVAKDGRWFFDTAAGKEELLNRRIGRNELSTLKAVRAYVEAQREYSSRDRDGSEVLKYAQRIISSPGTKDGLYWPPDVDGDISPLGPLVAEAERAGYGNGKTKPDETAAPFHGYYFRVLTRQGEHAPGGKHDYVVNGHMIGGFALVAWPAEYGQSGIMTFIVNQQGRVYQKDLGTKTATVARGMKTYDPDKTWTLSPD